MERRLSYTHTIDCLLCLTTICTWMRAYTCRKCCAVLCCAVLTCKCEIMLAFSIGAHKNNFSSSELRFYFFLIIFFLIFYFVFRVVNAVSVAFETANGKYRGRKFNLTVADCSHKLYTRARTKHQTSMLFNYACAFSFYDFWATDAAAITHTHTHPQSHTKINYFLRFTVCIHCTIWAKECLAPERPSWIVVAPFDWVFNATLSIANWSLVCVNYYYLFEKWCAVAALMCGAFVSESMELIAGS